MNEVKERFTTKEKLVDEIVSLLSPPRGERDVVRERLRTQSNTKLLRLHKVAGEIKERFDNKEKLVDDILSLMGHSKDKDRREKLLTFGPGRLLDLHRRHQPKAKAQAQQA